MKALLRSICRSVGDVFAICLFANVLLVTSLRADSKTDNAKEIGEITVICRSIIGSQFPYDGLPWQRPWQRLLRYLPDKNALCRTPLVCSGHCSGSVNLQNGLWLDFTFPNPQKFGEQWGPNDGIIDSVKLSRGDRVIFYRSKSGLAR